MYIDITTSNKFNLNKVVNINESKAQDKRTLKPIPLPTD